MSIDTKTWTTGSVPAGGSLEQSLLIDAAESRVWILKLQITPSASGGSSIYQVYYSSAFSGELAYEARANSLSPFYDPVKLDASGNLSNEGIGVIGVYEDEDAEGKFHVKISNQAAVARTYEVKIWYLVPTDPSHTHDDRYYTETEIDTNFYTAAEIDTLLGGYVAEALFDANSILAATDDNTPAALEIPEQRILGRVTAGVIAALTGAEVKTIVGDWDDRYYTETEIDTNFYTAAEVDTLLGGYVAEALFDANSILAATDDNTPAALEIPEQRILGRVTAGVIAALTGAEVKTIVGDWDDRYYTETEIDTNFYTAAEVDTLLGGYVAEALFDANSILAATDDNTPAALEIPEQRILGRVTAGAIAALTGAEVKTIIGSLDLSIGDVKLTAYSNSSADTATYYTAVNLTSTSGYLFQISAQANDLDADTVTVKITIDGGTAQELSLSGLAVAETGNAGYSRGLIIVCARYSSSLKVEIKHEEGSTLKVEAGIVFSEDQ